jgi:hypothetical protein
LLILDQTLQQRRCDQGPTVSHPALQQNLGGVRHPRPANFNL